FAKAPFNLVKRLLYGLLTLASRSRYSSAAPVCHGFLLLSHRHLLITGRRIQIGLLPSRFTTPAFLLLFSCQSPQREGNSHRLLCGKKSRTPGSFPATCLVCFPVRYSLVER